ncbi:TonB-dependent receptor domain-containing protein [Brumicola nitratireducens]|uniref:TonB-dependent receptor n=1 Tax=Glaciecola nitratireducens (strain JCM 12485 / KCTC 12276 / FR1064) TaxID=1085623 RepID=G4QKV3_GLANF|nr:TonB-dependent receptor [Glaciecola nitratireducens]AEP30406.1 TonB-dependent receptor [Glaciecola nitratireducens FR1064]
MFTNSKLAKSVKLACLFSAASLVGVAGNAAAQEESAEVVEKIQVTGSRFQRTDMETASPVQITSDVEIKLSGFTRIEDLLNSLPQIEAGQTSFLSNGASGTASLDLRGLGASRTLVLVNGRRLQPGGVYSQSPDINQIPAALVKRVEVLTGGGSTVYGADAVAGVVNFVMDTEFEGLQMTVGTGAYQHNNDNDYIQGLMDARGFEYPEGNSGLDGSSFNFDVTIGGAFDGGKGHAVAYATYRKDNELRQEARDYSSCALSTAGNSCGGSGNAIIPNFYMGTIADDGSYDFNNFNDYWTLNSTGFEIPSSGNIYNFAPVNHFLRPDERFSVGAFVNYEINEHFNPYLETSVMRDVTKAQIAESGTFFNEAYEIAYDSPLLSDTQRSQLTSELGVVSGENFVTYIGKRNVEGGPRASNLEHNQIRIVLGTKGEINDNWYYDTSFQFGTSASSAAYINDFFGPRITTAVDSEACAADSACIPYEVFTLNGVTPESAGALTGVGILNGETRQTVLTGYVTGDLDFTLPSADAPLAIVLGAEYRKEEFERLSDEVFEKGLLLGQGGPTASIAGSYSVKEIFSELSVPILENLTVEAGLRYSDYSTSGGETTYKIAADYDVVENYKLRASYNRAVRAPNVAELFSPQSLGLWSGVDPCSGSSPQLSAAQCANTGVTAAQYGNIAASPAAQYNAVFGGNPDLQVEVADTYTLGLVGQPTDDLNFSIDYWNIEMEDVIGAVGAELTVNQCATTGAASYCDNVNRNAQGSLWVGQSGFVQATSINLAGRQWEGIDLSVNHSYEIGDGKITTKLIGSYMMTKEYDAIPGDETAKYDCAGNVSTDCFAQPDWRHTATVTYSSDSFWSVSAKWRYFGGVDYVGSADRILLKDDGIGSQSYLDLKGSFEINDYTGVLVGVNNVLDKEPPLVGGALSSNANTVAGFYDTLGRYLHASVTFKF